MGTYIILGPPIAETMREPFTAAGLENLLPVPLSQVVELYSKTRSFQRVAEVLMLHRPQVRRIMSQASKTLSKSLDTRDKAIGAYLSDLIDKASASGQGFSRRKMAKQGDIYVTMPALLGEFRIPVTATDFDQIFVSRANR
jgi:hypothetical protein